jgi:hypothetical protein
MSTSVQAFTYQFTTFAFGNYANPNSILLALLNIAMSFLTIAILGWVPPVVCAVYNINVFVDSTTY